MALSKETPPTIEELQAQLAALLKQLEAHFGGRLQGRVRQSGQW